MDLVMAPGASAGWAALLTCRKIPRVQSISRCYTVGTGKLNKLF